MKQQRIRIHIQRSVGHTSVSLECPAEEREETVASAEKLLQAMPESSFQGDGVVVTSIPGFGPPDGR